MSRVGRIASLLPSATEIVCALGLEDRLVVSPIPAIIRHRAAASRVSPRPRFPLDGLSSGEIDAAVRQALREFGGVYEVDTERLAAVAPDLLLTQGVCEVCAVPTRDAGGCRHRPRVVPVGPGTRCPRRGGRPRDDSPRGRAGGVPERAEQCVRDIERRIAGHPSAVASRPAPRVLALEWLDPPFVPGHWLDGDGRAGRRNLVRGRGPALVRRAVGEWPVWIPTCCW